jgi:hypothetical protein
MTPITAPAGQRSRPSRRAGIAVALVPPLTTVAITLELGLAPEAQNALLLFVTNLAAAPSVDHIACGRCSGGSPHAAHLPNEPGLQPASAVTESVAKCDDAVRLIEIRADLAGGTAQVELTLCNSTIASRPLG